MFSQGCSVETFEVWGVNGRSWQDHEDEYSGGLGECALTIATDDIAVYSGVLAGWKEAGQVPGVLHSAVELWVWEWTRVGAWDDGHDLWYIPYGKINKNKKTFL